MIDFGLVCVVGWYTGMANLIAFKRKPSEYDSAAHGYFRFRFRTFGLAKHIKSTSIRYRTGPEPMSTLGPQVARPPPFAVE